MTDYYYVDCEDYREALSARLDNEEGPEDTRQPTDLHLEYCADCARWYNQAALITRRTRTSAAVAWPDVTEAVLAKVPAGAPLGSSRLRLALGAVGVAQGASALLTLLFHGSVDPATGYDTAAWNLALGVAFGAVAAGRTPPAGLVPLLGVFVGILSWGHVSGVVSGQVSPTGVLSHALAAIGFVLVVLLTRMPPVRRGPAPPAGSAARAGRHGVGKWGDGSRMTIRRTEPTKAA